MVTELRGRTDLDHYRGLAAANPMMAAVLVVSFLSLVGVPPLAGFVGKLTVFASAIDGGWSGLAVVAVANTVVSLFYYLRVLGAMYFDRSLAPVPVLGQWALTATLVAGAAILIVGVGAELMLDWFGGSALVP